MTDKVWRTLASLSILAATASPAAACINDRESPVLETKFKSDYLRPGVSEPSPSEDKGPALQYLAGGSGAALLFSGAALGLWPRRRSVKLANNDDNGTAT